MTDSLQPILCIGALYTGSERGLASDILASRARGFTPVTICTAIVVASHDAVTDLTEVPVDTVYSQLEHVHQAVDIAGVRIGILGSDRNAKAVLEWASGVDVPVVLELVASGPSGETVLPARGIDVVAEHLAVADLVLVSRQDAELVTGGEITSLDDAQVAAQRFSNRGAKGVLIDCGVLPARFYDAADDPGGDSAASPLASYLYFDGEDFALFEVPSQAAPIGRESLFAITAVTRLSQGDSIEVALQAAVRETVEATRHATPIAGGEPALNYAWRLREGTSGT
ncbi:bifunctional hydroxymethylpyrimidine kinase/phosphomethylpyrimidine kinase [Rubricoccus marinus]|uniref:Pyridoxamine kinase/Phosphomethylpyrimidine kinase domain-containing protein n=1 Tax=Rubricoccus marinus TaxID=716817 RepID=A0A259TYW7_9BACT|nr:bifunctional hydroxymethylpyrimidine kinase/phosphomethylpyrimidine kinase [Rubricoccus marinus]OZC02778.1 hypothetical protein BSZ36_07200 [Rubricoccus marinus]